MGYTLTEYLVRGDYEASSATYASYDEVCADVAPDGVSQIIAVDGPTNSGKSSVAQALIDHYTANGIAVAALPLDYFLTDRQTRQGVFEALEAGEADASTYSHAAWEHDKYRTCLLAARSILLGEVGDTETLVIPDTYNRVTGKRDEEKSVRIPAGGVVVTEGVGLHAYHSEFFDMRIRTDVGDDGMLLGRVLARERQKPVGALRLSDGYLAWRYNLVDAPHTVYLRELSAGTAEAVVDTSRFDDVIVYKRKNT